VIHMTKQIRLKNLSEGILFLSTNWASLAWAETERHQRC
jgi:hypothetical protein